MHWHEAVVHVHHLFVTLSLPLRNLSHRALQSDHIVELLFLGKWYSALYSIPYFHLLPIISARKMTSMAQERKMGGSTTSIYQTLKRAITRKPLNT